MYKLYGALGSPYSMKLRALLRYRRIPHLWVDGAATREALGQVRAPVIPVLQYPDGHYDNDSTPVLYDLEERHGERRVVPDDPAQAFIAHLLEDFADEWLTKAMFGYRWLEAVDQVQMSRWLAFDNMKGGGLAQSQGRLLADRCGGSTARDVVGASPQGPLRGVSDGTEYRVHADAPANDMQQPDEADEADEQQKDGQQDAAGGHEVLPVERAGVDECEEREGDRGEEQGEDPLDRAGAQEVGHRPWGVRTGAELQQQHHEGEDEARERDHAATDSGKDRDRGAGGELLHAALGVQRFVNVANSLIEHEG